MLQKQILKRSVKIKNDECVFVFIIDGALKERKELLQ